MDIRVSADPGIEYLDGAIDPAESTKVADGYVVAFAATRDPQSAGRLIDRDVIRGSAEFEMCLKTAINNLLSRTMALVLPEPRRRLRISMSTHCIRQRRTKYLALNR